MSVRATLTMLVSMTSSSAPMATATATAHLLTGRAEVGAMDEGTADIAMAPPLLPRVDGEIDAHARAKRDAGSGIADVDAHGNPLDHFGEVAARVVGRE